ncbi:hypothetical protein [Bradyrhizobium sp. BR 1432]|uniref:hypothetical protein n=1 Tax=Bradyrhizobium sp. BR 1432 TaxID=3447966 RepID=UPI003EE7745A
MIDVGLDVLLNSVAICAMEESEGLLGREKFGGCVDSAAAQTMAGQVGRIAQEAAPPSECLSRSQLAHLSRIDRSTSSPFAVFIH